MGILTPFRHQLIAHLPCLSVSCPSINAAVSASPRHRQQPVLRMNMGGQPPFVIALLVAVPVLVLVIVALLVYVCCHRRYKLNWYERSLLDSGATDDHTTSSHLLGASASSGANSNVGTLFSTGSTTTGNHGSFNATPVLVPQTVVEYVTVRGKMGSYPSSPLSSPTSEHSSGEWEERSKDTFSFPLPSPGSTLSPWGYKTMEIDNGLGSNPDSRLEPKRNSLTSQSTCKSDISAYVPVQPFRRFSAGATPGGESRQTPSGIFPIPNTDDKNTTPQNRKKRSNSLIPQLAMPLTNYLKSGMCGFIY